MIVLSKVIGIVISVLFFIPRLPGDFSQKMKLLYSIKCLLYDDEQCCYPGMMSSAAILEQCGYPGLII